MAKFLGGCMTNKKELAQNLAGALVAILLGCIIVIWIISSLPNTTKLDGALVANVLVAGVTLFAPLAAYYFYDSWKDQKRYDLGQNYADKSLAILNNIYKELITRYSHFQIENLLNENNLVALNRIHKYKYDLNVNLYELSAYSQILIDLFPNKINEEKYKKIETEILYFQNALQYVENKYISYYYALPEKMKNFDYTTTLQKNEDIKNLSLICIRENIFLDALKKKIKVEIMSNPILDNVANIDSYKEISFDSYVSDFNTEYNNYRKELISIIKI